jgi:glc operon protein GlcG
MERRTYGSRFFGGAAAALTVALFAALPASAGDVRPLMTLDMAKKMADACEAAQAAAGWPKVNVAIVDRGADLVLFRRQDDAFLGSVDIAINKAKSAASIPFPTRTIAELVYGKDGKPGDIPGLAFADVVAFAGGLPVNTASGALVGAIGVSGATSDQDEDCAKAGIAAIADQLK